METKRCTYCQKLQRVGNRVCSRCGHSFGRRGSRSWPSSVSLFSLPAASPHRVGHYSGLHPEDQPYQSQVMVTPQRFMQEMLEKEALQQEPKHIVLPSAQDAPVSNRRRGISQIPTRRQLPSRRSRRHLASEHTRPGKQETQRTNGRGTQREQISRPFVREVVPARASLAPTELTVPPPRARTNSIPAELTVPPARAGVSLTPTELTMPPARARTSLASTEVIPEEFELTAIQQTQKVQDRDRGWEQTPELPLEDPLFSLTSDTTLSVEDLPSYMQKALHTKPWPSRIMSTALISVGFCVLLATSISVLVLMGNRPTSAPLPNVATHTPGEQAKSSTSPHLKLSTSQTTFDPSASGIVSSQTITLVNGGGSQVAWQESSDQRWLTTSPESGTFTDHENIQITVNRGGVSPGDYTGHVAFSLQGQENTPAVLNVTMSVASGPAQLSISTTSLSYSTVQSQAPDSQAITISNTGGKALHWDATVSTPDTPSWLTLSQYHGVTPAGISQSLTVQVSSQTLAIGSYKGLITFTGDANAKVEVSLVVVASDNLLISPSSLAFTTQQTNQTLSLHNGGSRSVRWSVRLSTNERKNWLSVTPAKGTLGPGQSVTITIYADPKHLSPDSYQGTLTFSVGNQTKNVSVSFIVTGTPPTPTPTTEPTPTPTPISTPTPTPTPIPTPTSTSAEQHEDETR